MKASVLKVAVGLLILSLLAGCVPIPAPAITAPAEPEKVWHVGYSVIVSHPSLDENLKGIMDALKEAGYEEGKNLEFEVQNAQGDVTNAHNIAEKFVSEKKDLIIGMTTPCAQAIVKAAEGTDIPIIYLAITDPVGAGLVKSVDEPSGSSITGYYAPPPVAELFALYAEILPTMRRVGTIYNPGETNAVAEVALSKAVAEKLGYEWVEAVVASTADVKAAADSLVGKVDAIVITHDNTVVSAIDAVVKVGQDNKIAVFPMDPDSVVRGGIAAFSGNTYYEGVEMGQLIARVLGGEDPGSILPVKPTKFNIYINAKSAAAMGVTVPDSVLAKATEVIK